MKNNLRRKRNIITQEIAQLKKKGKDVKTKMKEVKAIPDKIRKLETQADNYKKKAKTILMKLPNILHESVPYGKDENDNVVVRTWGKPPKFDFKPKNHMEIALDLRLIDAERARRDGITFYKATDGVYVARRIPSKYIRKLE